MRISGLLAATALVLAACGRDDGAAAPSSGNEGEASTAASEAAPGPAANAARTPASSGWDLRSSGEGIALVLPADARRTVIRLFCPAGGSRLLVNVPGFRPIGSEERLSFGSGGEAIALVADPSGDAGRGGVSGTVEVPGNLDALVGGPISASYGAQSSGPHPAPPQKLARAFAAACREGAAPARTAVAAIGACHLQDGKPVGGPALRAVGTEPFWGARIEGRCVTYSHPEDQRGTRIWTRYTAGPGGASTWSGALGGRRFELKARPQPGCSDGMSDRRYPVAVDLVVDGERRTGCAEPRVGAAASD